MYKGELNSFMSYHNALVLKFITVFYYKKQVNPTSQSLVMLGI